jgi:uncharacterized protein YyaL (SSP411 family)
VNSLKNRLINEKSPYLQQHADNPVNWFPWGNEAFEKAKLEDKPVFLSIGYSTCHWCHVMAHESFVDSEVADILNKHFVSVKVDREERPDVDAVYMSVCQAMTGSGGWPLTIIMTPEQKPFYAGTYLPKTSLYGRLGLTELLVEVIKLWDSNRKKIYSAGDDIVKAIQENISVSNRKVTVSKEIVKNGYKQLKQNYEPIWAGFGSAPKFPMAHNLLFLLKYSEMENESKAKEMAEKTLEQMYRGGIYDHIGGGFSRYSTDEKWLVPHFEKMLYDNALLIYAYTEAYRLTGRPLYRKAAEKTIEYVLRELTNIQGGFLCGQDADSEGVEGKYYVFTPEEIKAQLGRIDGELFCSHFEITEKGNFEGKSIPNLINNKDIDKENEKIYRLCSELYKYRILRTVFHKDDKVLTSWNALMIAALAKAAITFDEPSYLEAAKKAEHFITKNLVDASGRLLVRWREGEAGISGHLDDYAFYIFALLELYDNSFDLDYLIKARHYTLLMTELFFDNENGGFYFYASDAEKLISRPKELYDGAIPSGNSVAAYCLIRLAALCGDISIKKIVEKQLEYISSEVSSYPSAYCVSLLAIMRELYPSAEIICVTSENEPPEELVKFMSKAESINLNVLLKTPSNAKLLKELVPDIDNYAFPTEGSVYYLCKNKACSAPVKSIEELSKLLNYNEVN